jgi:hypothetical protein
MFFKNDVGKLHATVAERLLLSKLVIVLTLEPSKFAQSPLRHIDYTKFHEPDKQEILEATICTNF